MVLDLPTQAKELTDTLEGMDGLYEVTIKKYTESVSQRQRGYLWGVIYTIIAVEIGELTDAVHTMLKAKFLHTFVNVNGEEYIHIKSTSELNKQELSLFIEEIRIWAWHELNCHIPAAEEVTDEMMEQIKKEYSQIKFFNSI